MSAPATLTLTQASRGPRELPFIGYGTYKVPPEDTARLVNQALVSGYRHLDTAQMYGNEAEVGQGLRTFLAAHPDVSRDDIFLTTKLDNPNHAPDRVLSTFAESLAKLGVAEVDLFLIHWPLPAQGDYVRVWQQLLGFLAGGRARSVGVSNFEIHHLEALGEATGQLPALNQVEMHPHFQNRAVRDWCQAHAIVVEAWSPLGRGSSLADPVVQQVATELGATPAQVVLAWHIAHGVSVIPKSSTAERMADNYAATRLQLSDAQLAAIDALDEGEAGRIGARPDARS